MVMKREIQKPKAKPRLGKHGAKIKASRTERDIDFVSYEPVKRQKEISRFRISLAKIFQNFAYICLFIGVLALVDSIIGLVITYWPQPEILPSGNTSTDFGNGGWIQIQFLTYALIMNNPVVIIFEVILAILIILLIIWIWRLVVRITRRLTWRLSDEIMKPLALVEPISLLVVWTLAIVVIWFLLDDKLFWSASLVSLAFLCVGLLSFFAMRKLANDYLDYTRAESVLRRL